MPKFRKKPVVIEAMQYTHENENEILEFIGDKVEPETYEILECGENLIVINTLEGYHNTRPGDWIIKGVNGEFYPCKSDIFEKTYERVD